MNRTNTSTISDNRICVTRPELARMLGCGQSKADSIAEKAMARIWIGKRVLISVEKVKKYLDEECR